MSARGDICRVYNGTTRQTIGCTMHLGPSRDEDTLVAAQLCGALGIPHILLDQPPFRLQAEVRNNIKTNFCADEHAQYLALADYVAGRYDCLYAGIGGDVLSNRLFANATRLALFADGRFKDLAEDLFQAFPIASRGPHETLLRELLPPLQYRRFNRESAITSLSEELSRHAHAPNPVASFFSEIEPAGRLRWLPSAYSANRSKYYVRTSTMTCMII